MVVVLDRDADLLERLDRLVAQLGRGVLSRHREVAALVERLRALRVLEQEVLELWADVERVEAELLHPLQRAPQHVAWVALVGLAVRRDHVTDHPADLRLARAPRHHDEGGGVRDRDHVRFLDRVEARDRRAVEAHPVVERVLELRRRDREALQVSLEVGEPEENELDVLRLHPFHHVRALRRIARGPRRRFDCCHTSLLVRRNKKGPGRLPEAASPQMTSTVYSPGRWRQPRPARSKRFATSSTPARKASPPNTVLARSRSVTA